MINISRPVVEIPKIIEKPFIKALDDNFSERKAVVRKPMESLKENKEENSENKFSREQLQDAIKSSNKMIFGDDNRFEFKIHDRTGRMIVKLIDKKTDEVIKEIPSEKILDLVASIWDLVGVLVDERG